MTQNANDEAQVSKTYQLLNQSRPGLEPPRGVELKIKQLAAESIDSSRMAKKKRLMVPLSIAASVALTSVIGLKLIYFDHTTVNDLYPVDSKKPMFMLQRSKPASVDKMVIQLNRYLDQGEIDKARQLYKKMRYYFPDYQADRLLADKLSAENIN